jgi:TolB-like protein
VLLFENLRGDPTQEYLSDGITQELSEQLGNLNPQQIGVIGRTSATTYKHSPRTISQIGRELAVDYVLEGSVRHEASKLRVTAQLVEVYHQAHIWAQDYDWDPRDLLQVEDDIAFHIARQVGVSIASVQPSKSLPLHQSNPEAHEAYLLARYYWNIGTREHQRVGRTATSAFAALLKKDSEYAAAYAGLAECGIPSSSNAHRICSQVSRLCAGSTCTQISHMRWLRSERDRLDEGCS